MDDENKTRSERLKKRFERFMEGRFALRLHMCLILSATLLSGILISKILLVLHFEPVVIRYPFSVLLSYLVFLGLLRLWVFYITSHRTKGRSGESGDLLFDSSGPSGDAPLSGGGGEYGGAGASGDYGGGATVVSEGSGSDEGSLLGNYALVPPSGDAGGLGLSGPDHVSPWGAVKDLASDGDGGGDGDGLLPLIAVGLIVLFAVALISSGLFLIFHAPTILSEITLQFLLATGLRRHSKISLEDDLPISILRYTYKPFALVLIVAIVLGIFIQVYFPGVTKLSELFHHL